VVRGVRSCAASREGGSGQRLIKRIVAFSRLGKFISVERRRAILGYGRKNASRPAVLIDEMPHYDEARLVRLLRLLRVPPLEWVRRAQRIPLTAGMLTDQDVEELARKLNGDLSFRRHFDADPVAATEAAGMYKVSLRLRTELRALVAGAEQIASDGARRADFVAALGDPGAVLEALSASGAEVEAHVLDQQGLEKRVLLLLLSSAAVGDELRAAVDRA
jgi:hypothetical protein